MASLTVGGVAIPVAPGSGSWDWNDAVDRRRAFDNTYRASSTGGAARDGRWATPPVSRANAGIYRGVLQQTAAQICSGDLIEIPTMCCAELINESPVKQSVGSLVTLNFALHEVQGKKLLLKYSPGDTITGESFSRSTSATYVDSNMNLATAAINVKRDSHRIASQANRYTLLEDASVNLCLQSENFGTTWTALGTPTRAAADHTSTGITFDLIGDDSAAAVEGYEQNIGTFTGNTSKGISLYVRQGTSTSTVIRVQETAGPTDRLFATLTWSGGLPVIVMTTGTYLGYELLNNAVFRLKFSTTSITAANNQQIGIYPATTAAFAVANTGNLHVGGVMAENIPLCSSYLKTTTASVSRSADSYSLPFTTPPQEITVYAKFVEGGTAQIGGTRVFEIGSAGDANPRFLVYPPSGKYSSYHGTSVSSVESDLAAAVVIGDTVEIVARLFGDGSVDISQSLNSAAATSAAQTAALAMATAWASPLVWLNAAGDHTPGFTALQSFKIVAGSRSLSEMRAL